ncbi:MAG: D-sedoheptulose 7-phosphate isomerase [Edaphobacter sp.]
MKDLIIDQLSATLRVIELARADASIADGLLQAAEKTANAMRRGNKLMIAGNGGSAADAQHLVAEFVSRLTVDRPALRAIALTTDSSILTAVGNDYSYDKVFERQLEALGLPGDIFLAISTSGNSRNLLNALDCARNMKISTIGLSGNNGGEMAEKCGINIVVPSRVTMKVQECHLALEHIFCMLVERYYFGPNFDAKFDVEIRALTSVSRGL